MHAFISVILVLLQYHLLLLEIAVDISSELIDHFLRSFIKVNVTCTLNKFFSLQISISIVSGKDWQSSLSFYF